MAPPKRKTSGRVTPKGTRPGQASRIAREAPHTDHGVEQSSRYTPPTPKDFYESPRWVPIMMIVFIAVGVLAIILRYIVWENSNVPVLVGLVFLLAGLFTATKWR